MLLGLAYRLVEADRHTRAGKFRQEQSMALIGLGCPQWRGRLDVRGRKATSVAQGMVAMMWGERPAALLNPEIYARAEARC